MWKFMLMSVFTAIVLANPVPAFGQAGDEFEGAVWHFTATSKTKPVTMMRGMFRVSDYVVYQKNSREDKEATRKTGTIHPNANNTRHEQRNRIVFTDMRVRIDDKEEFRMGVKGTARLKMRKYGEWFGIFTDGEGRNWNFECRRVQE